MEASKKMMFQALGLLSIFFFVSGQNLIQNPSFESSGSWSCAKCAVEYKAEDAQAGTTAAYITNRTKTWSGLQQVLSGWEQGSHYKVELYFKIIESSAWWNTFRLMFIQTVQIDGVTTKYLSYVINQPRCEVSQGWKKMAGDFSVHPDAVKVKLRVEVKESESIDFAVDNVSVSELTKYPDWLATAEADIESNRKEDITIGVRRGEEFQRNVTIEVSQKNNDFKFGTSINEGIVLDSNHAAHAAYMDFLSSGDLFNTAVVPNSCKWRFSEKNKDDTTGYQKCVEVMRVLHQHGIKNVRFHAISWGKSEKLPYWLFGLNTTEIYDEIVGRINDINNLVLSEIDRPEIFQVDVNNENLHGETLEELTNNKNITQEMFHLAHHALGTQLYANDYSVLCDGSSTNAFKEYALELCKAGVPIGGIGAQCHGAEKLDLVSVAHHRLAVLEEVHQQCGASLAVTEMDVRYLEEGERGRTLADLFTLLYSKNWVSYVGLWYVSDLTGSLGDWDAEIIQGNNCTLNEAGRALRDRLAEWRTEEIFTDDQINQQNSVHTLRGFHGRYEISATVDGSTVTANFNLLPQNNVNCDIDAQYQNISIACSSAKK